MDHGRSWLSMFLFNNTELHIRFIQDYRHDACLYLETVKRAIQGSVFPLEYIRDDVFLPHMHTLLNLAAKWIQERKIWPFSDLIYILTACYRSKTWPDVNVQLFATCLGAALEYESDKDFSFGYSPLLVETVVDAMLQLLHDSEGPVILDMFNVNAIEAMQLRMVYFRDEENAKKLIELREKLLELCT